MTLQPVTKIRKSMLWLVRHEPSFSCLTSHLKCAKLLSGSACAPSKSRLTHWELSCAGFEARGFIFGAPLALQLQCAFVPLRKPGKLPGKHSCTNPSAVAASSYAAEILKDLQHIVKWPTRTRDGPTSLIPSVALIPISVGNLRDMQPRLWPQLARSLAVLSCITMHPSACLI